MAFQQRVARAAKGIQRSTANAPSCQWQSMKSTETTSRRYPSSSFKTKSPPSSSTSFQSRLVLWDKSSQEDVESSTRQNGLKEEVDPGKIDGTDLMIVKYPHPALRRPNDEITMDELKEGSISKLAKEMLLLMYAAEGVGLAAPQVGVNKRLMVYNESGDSKKWLDEVVLVNPRIVEFSGATNVETEGCLSFPDMDGKVQRSKWIKVEALNLKGKKIKKKYVGWEARIFQHEYDHLDGTVYIDRLSTEDRSRVQPTLDALVQQHEEKLSEVVGAPAL